MFCPICGAKNELEGTEYCINCGAKFSDIKLGDTSNNNDKQMIPPSRMESEDPESENAYDIEEDDEKSGTQPNTSLILVICIAGLIFSFVFYPLGLILDIVSFVMAIKNSDKKTKIGSVLCIIGLVEVIIQFSSFVILYKTS